jgi:hypothetical protein
MTRIVSPEEFNAAFLGVSRRREAEIAAVWEDWPRFTELALDGKNGLLATVAQELGLQYCQEYWNIDAIMYEKLDTENFPPDGGWNGYLMAEQLAVVIEHENNVGTAQEEMNKLSVYNSPLKVLFTYPEEEGVEDCSRMYADILRRADVFNDFTLHRRHLVIFGFMPKQDVRWESYVYRLGEFVPLGAKP